MKSIKTYFLLLISILSFAACSDDNKDDGPIVEPGEQVTLLKQIDEYRDDVKLASSAYTYNDKGQIVKIEETEYNDQNGSVYCTTTYTFTRTTGKIVVDLKEVYSNSKEEDGSQKYELTLDNLGRIVRNTVFAEDGVTAEEVYDYTWGNGFITKVTIPASEGVSAYSHTITLADNLADVKNTTGGYTDDSSPSYKYEYSYNFDITIGDLTRVNYYSLMPFEHIIVVDGGTDHGPSSIIALAQSRHEVLRTLSVRKEIGYKKPENTLEINRTYKDQEDFTYEYDERGLPSKVVHTYLSLESPYNDDVDGPYSYTYIPVYEIKTF